MLICSSFAIIRPLFPDSSIYTTIPPPHSSPTLSPSGGVSVLGFVDVEPPVSYSRATIPAILSLILIVVPAGSQISFFNDDK